MITSGPAFADYFDGVRRRTRDFVEAVPATRVDWAPRAGEYTCGDALLPCDRRGLRTRTGAAWPSGEGPVEDVSYGADVERDAGAATGRFESLSGIPVEPLYTPEDLAGWRYEDKLG